MNLKYATGPDRKQTTFCTRTQWIPRTAIDPNGTNGTVRPVYKSGIPPNARVPDSDIALFLYL